MRPLAMAWVLALLAPALAGCVAVTDDVTPAAAGAPTGYVLYNGTVWTADDRQRFATAVAVRGERIVAVGTDAEALAADAGPRPVAIDLHGKMALPGFHDTHNHFIEVARAADPGDGNPYAPWPPGWDPVGGTVAQQATAAEHVGTWAGHNVDRVLRGDAPAPPVSAGMHGVEAELAHGHDGHLAPAGRHAANDLWFGEPARENDAEAWRDMLRLGLETGARYGLTSHVEAGTPLDSFAALEALDAEGALTARFNLYVFPEDLDAVVDRGWATGSGDDDVRLLGLKIYSDGWLGPRTAALREPYDDRPHRGFAFYTQEEADAFVLKAHRNGLKVTAHAIGDRATEMLLSSYERALVEGCPAGAGHVVCEDPRFTLEHVQLVPPDLMARMVGVGLVPSIQLSFATSDAPWAEDALGAERLAHAYPWATFVEEGLVVGGSSDFPIEVLPPLWGVQRAVTRADLNGEPAGGFMPEQRLALDAALRTITINAAHLEYREHELGSLTAGKLADIVVLDRDLFNVPPEDIAAAQVELTMVGGAPVYADGAVARALRGHG